ncbi:MAG TPA: hypothetical protein VF532_21670 [Candidatus Angelobacter sp.]
MKRRTYRELPFFFLYTVSASLIGGLRFLAFYLGRTPYFYTYWISELAGTILVFLALYELFLRRLFPGFHKSGFYRNLFPLAAVVFLLLTVLAALFAHDKQSVFVSASRQFDFLRTAVLVFFTALMLLMGRNWNRYELGIAAGFAVQAAAALANAAIRIRSRQQSHAMDTLEVVAYELSCFIWLITFLRPSGRIELQLDESGQEERLREARSWETALKQWLRPRKRML